MKNKIFVPSSAFQYIQMFEDRGFKVVPLIEDADLVQFIGGADVSPRLYDEGVHPTTRFSRMTDMVDQETYNRALDLGIPMAGICRGGQFLHVMNGGKMWQDVDGHGVFQGHFAECEITKRRYLVSSTHHQMMVGNVGEIILTAKDTNNTYKESFSTRVEKQYGGDYIEVEGVYHPATRCLSFQPHPEICRKDSECQELYFHYLEHFFGVKA